jgi:drug/metabolite transporter (DMT)-like permease
MPSGRVKSCAFPTSVARPRQIRQRDPGRLALTAKCGTAQVMTAPRRFLNWLDHQPYVLMLLTTLYWGGNVVAGKLAATDVSPLVITFIRWLIVSVVLVALLSRSILQEAATLRHRWRYVLLMSMIGFTGFNALFYLAAAKTSALNVAIIQGSTPVFVVIGALLLGSRMTMLQISGVLLTLIGVVLTASRGDFDVLRGLAFNEGDLWLLIASFLYAGYTLALRTRPQMTALAFFAGMAVGAFVSSVPLVIAEVAAGAAVWPGTLQAWLIMLYIAFFPSLLAQIHFVRAVELIGPGRVSAFYNLVPVFGAILTVLIIGEKLALYHLVALALVLAGIALVNRPSARS